MTLFLMVAVVQRNGIHFTNHYSLLTILAVGAVGAMVAMVAIGAGGAMGHQESFFVILIPCGTRPAGGGRRILPEVVRYAEID